MFSLIFTAHFVVFYKAKDHSGVQDVANNITGLKVSPKMLFCLVVYMLSPDNMGRGILNSDEVNCQRHNQKTTV